MNKNIEKKLDDYFKSCPLKVNSELFYDFFRLIEGVEGVDENAFFDLMINDIGIFNFNKNSSGLNFALPLDYDIQNGKKFISYLVNLFKKEDPKFALNFLMEAKEFIIQNVSSVKSKENAKKKEADPMHLFVKFVSLKCCEDIKIEYRGLDKFKQNPGSEDFFIEARLGDFPIVCMSVDVNSATNCLIKQEDEEILAFSDFRTFALLENQRLGSLVLQDFFRLIKRDFPDFSPGAVNILRDNADAIRFYRRFGAKLYGGVKGNPYYAIFRGKKVEELVYANTISPLGLIEFNENKRKSTSNKIATLDAVSPYETVQ